MRFTELDVKGAVLIELEPRRDARGFFARAFCAREFGAAGLNPSIVQSNLAVTDRRGTIRGLHYRVAAALEAKVCRCTRGAVYDVLGDLRPESPTYLRHVGVELTADNRSAPCIPELCASGYQALTGDAEVVCDGSGFYGPEHERGVQYDDPTVGIRWPVPPCDIWAKDSAWPLLPRTDGARRACAVAMTADPAAKRCGGGRVSTASFGSNERGP